MKLLWTSTSISRNASGTPRASLRRTLDAAKNLGTSLPAARFPLILERDGKPCREAFSYLYALAVVSGSTSEKTLATYAESLLDWLSFAEARQFQWRSPTTRQLAEYRNSMLGQGAPQARRAKPLARRTVNLRLTVAIDFTRSLAREPNALAPEHKRQDQHNSQRPPDTKRLLVRVSRPRPRALTPEACHDLLSHLKQPHRLVFRWQLATGLRTSSVLAIKLSHIQSLLAKHSDHIIDVPSKGSQVAIAYVPKDLLEETLRYIEIDRRLSRANSRQIIEPSCLDEPLFVNSLGTPLTNRTYAQAFRRASVSSGIQAHPHQARTTFATNIERTLRRLKTDEEELDTVKIVQALLGHASASTTAHYLESIAGYNEDILKAIEEFSSQSASGTHD